MDGPDSSKSYEKAYEEFSLFTNENLKSSLAKRGWQTGGAKPILLAKAVTAWANKAQVVPNVIEASLQANRDYQSLLATPTGFLTDPKVLPEDEWMGEQEAVCNWPPIYISDISEYLMKAHPDNLQHRLLNEYKEGKAYRLETSRVDGVWNTT